MASQTQLVPPMAQTAPTRDPNSSGDMRATLLFAAIESFTVGLVIIAQNGTILHKNSHAQNLLEEMSCSPSQVLPNTLWQACQSLMEKQDEPSDLFPEDTKVVLEDEISTDHSVIRMRAQWFDWSNSDCQHSDCFLITLEDRQQSLSVIASQESQRYGLTTRETDVWTLKRVGHSYKEIAAELYISENTVKKHLKNIYAKKEQSTWSV